jgi:hypothetical protein
MLRFHPQKGEGQGKITSRFFLLIALTFVGGVTGVAGDKKAPLSAGV